MKLLLFALLLTSPTAIHLAAAENMVFPADAGMANVKTDFGAKGDGITDDTAAIQKAIDTVKGIPDTLYFPNGTYLVSDSVGIFNGKAHSRDRFLTYQGQSEAGTIIRLKDSSAGFGDNAKPKTVFSVYQGQGTGDVMHSYVRNLSIDVGAGNPGAIGLRFMTNNTGAMYHVTIRSSDPKKAGKIGLDMSQGQNGPCLIKYVTVDGFDTGIETGSAFSLVFEHITLKNQNVLGFLNKSATTIRRLTSTNRVPALTNDHRLTLIEASFTGGDPANTAISNSSKRFFVRDLKQSGYGHLLKDSSEQNHDGATLDEWYEGKVQSLFPGAAGTEAKSLRLPIKETPEVPWETDLTKWVKADWVKPGDDMSDILQAAIDQAAKTGKTTIYIPRRRGTYEYPKLGKPIRVHGSVNRIIGMCNIVGLGEDTTGELKAGKALFTIENLTSDAVVFERFFSLAQRKKLDAVFMFENKSGKAVVIQNMSLDGMMKKPGTSGAWFIEDVAPDRNNTLFIGKGETCWARQFNPESYKANILEVDGGRFWVLGLKTEGRATHIIARNNAQVELLGGISYQSWGKQELDPPMFTVIDSDASFTFGFHHHKDPFTTIVSETRGAETKTLPRADLLNYHLPLFRAYSGKPASR